MRVDGLPEPTAFHFVDPLLFSQLALVGGGAWGVRTTATVGRGALVTGLMARVCATPAGLELTVKWVGCVCPKKYCHSRRISIPYLKPSYSYIVVKVCIMRLLIYIYKPRPA